MIPLRDTIRSRSFPLVNLSIIALNVLVFIYEISLSPHGLDRLIATYGLVPDRLHLTQPLLLLNNPLPLITMFSHMFLHGGWLHIISNMWVLFIFGDNVEDRMGSIPYFIFYMICGVVSGFTQAFIAPSSNVPAIGASGAIAGVLAAYMIFFPRARVVTFVPLIILPWFINIPAVIFIVIWFLLQFFSGVAALEVATSGGVAYWAHVGGFIC